MDADPACEQAVAIDVLYHVIFGGAGSGQGSRHDFFPGFKILACVAYNHRLAGCPRGGMVLDDILAAGGEEFKGVVVSNILFRGEREPAYVIH